MKRTRWVPRGLVLLAFTGTVWAAPPSYRVTELQGFAPAVINNLGQIAGTTAGGAVLYSNGTLTTLGGLGGGRVDVNGLNDLGQVTGDALTPGGLTHAFVWRNGAMHDLGTLGGASSTGAAINNSGWVTGTSVTSGGVRSAFLYDGSTMHDLGAIFPAVTANGLNIGGSFAYGLNDAGHVVGALEVDGDFGYHAYLYDGSLRDLSGDRGQYGFADDLNDSGQVIGRDVCCWSFIHDNGSTTLIGNDPDYWEISARAINEHGQAVFHTYTGNGAFGSPLLYDDGALHKISDLLGPSGQGLYMVSAWDINDAGQILASGVPRSEMLGDDMWMVGTSTPRAYLLTPIPEPETYALMAAGLLLLALRSRAIVARRSRTTPPARMRSPRLNA